MTRNNYVSDNKDLVLIKELIKNGRVSYSKLAQITGLAYASVREKIERLINKGLLEIKPLVSPKIYGKQAAILRIKTDDLESIVSVLSGCNKVLSIVKTVDSIVVVIVGRSKVEIAAVVEALIGKCGKDRVREYIVEYGVIPLNFMIPLRNNRTSCSECIFIKEENNVIKCSGCLPVLRVKNN